MLTADLVNARRKGTELRLVSLDDDARARACAIAEKLIAAAREHVGLTREELVAAIGAIDVGPREHRLKDGLAKLIEDRCELDANDAIDPEALRCDVFTRASAARASLEAHERFDRDGILASVAHTHGIATEAVERALFADLRGAHLLVGFDAPSPESLVAAYERGQAQAVLLRAVKVTVDVRCATAGALRAFFRRLKFLRLLHSITKLDGTSPAPRGRGRNRVDGGHRVIIDGPFSLFESITKYGLQLALMLPALEQCDAWRLEADVRWGKERTPLTFRIEGGAASPSTKTEEPALPDEIRALARSFNALGTSWNAVASTAILELPGVGLAIPDLVFTRSKGSEARERVYLEVMGYWSRAAVWQRVELVQAGLAERMLFAVSSRLRVREDVLEGDLPGALYVYKGTMSARAIADRLDRISP